MIIFRNLYLRGSAEQIAALVAAVERSLTDGWARDAAAEKRMCEMATHEGEITYSFSCAEAGERPAASVFLMEKEPGLYFVSNVVPHKQRQLTHNQYNAILEELYERFIRGPAEQLGVQAELTPANVGIEHWLSRETAEKLRRFSAAANKSTGSSHPSDQQRWMDFILAVHRDHSKLDALTLRRWLIESEGWPPEVADGLALEYDFGKDILDFAQHRLGA